MSEELNVSCARPIGSEVDQGIDDSFVIEGAEASKAKKEETTMIMVGRKAPDFSAPGYHDGKFVNVKLSDFQGKWVVLCFYPGDFTFV